MKKKLFLSEKNKKRQILSWNSFPPHLWNIKCPIVERIIWPLVGHILNRRCGGEGQNNDVSHDRAPLIRLIAQLWNSCSTIGLQDLANHQSWNHVNSLIAELRKMQHFCKYFLPGSAMHTKSIYTSQDFILQIDMIIILTPEVIWSKSHHPNPCYWQKTSILFHNWIRSVDGYFTLFLNAPFNTHNQAGPQLII